MPWLYGALNLLSQVGPTTPDQPRRPEWQVPELTLRLKTTQISTNTAGAAYLEVTTQVSVRQRMLGLAVIPASL